jgi:putative Mn2+ efflux pump MntP
MGEPTLVSSALFIAGISVAANVDNLGVGFSYGLLRKAIPLGANGVIAAVSVLFALAGYTCGALIARFVSATVANDLGGAILIAIGLWAFVDLFRSQKIEIREVDARETFVLAVALAINAGAGGIAGGVARESPLALAAGIGICSLLAIAIGQVAAARLRWSSVPAVTQVAGAIGLIAIGIWQFTA